MDGQKLMLALNQKHRLVFFCNKSQIFSVIFHFDIKNEKIWLQQNISDYDIVGDIEAKGVPKSDIVLAFHSPQMRQFTGYAVA